MTGVIERVEGRSHPFYLEVFMKSILYFGLGYIVGGMCVGYGIVYFLKKEGILYDGNL